MQLQLDLNTRQVCGTCKFNKSDITGYYCNNGESDRYAEHTMFDDTCGEWEGKDNG